jgi:hypothetical protein
MAGRAGRGLEACVAVGGSQPALVRGRLVRAALVRAVAAPPRADRRSRPGVPGGLVRTIGILTPLLLLLAPRLGGLLVLPLVAAGVAGLARATG